MVPSLIMNCTKIFNCISMTLLNKKNRTSTSQSHRGFRTKIGCLELFLEFKLCLPRALSSDTSLELPALTSNFASFFLLCFSGVSCMYACNILYYLISPEPMYIFEVSLDLYQQRKCRQVMLKKSIMMAVGRRWTQ